MADDSTGASDLADTLNRNGLYALRMVGVPASGLKVEDRRLSVAVKIGWMRGLASWEEAADERVLIGFPRAARGSDVQGLLHFRLDPDAGNIGPVAEALGAKARGARFRNTRPFRRPADRYLGHCSWA